MHPKAKKRIAILALAATVIGLAGGGAFAYRKLSIRAEFAASRVEGLKASADGRHAEAIEPLLKYIGRSPNDVEVSGLPVTLVVANATDPDSDVLTYHFELYSDSSLSQKVDEVNGLAEGSSQTSWTPSANLEENQPYWWRARATDGHAYGPWSSIASFRVNVVNEAPSAPTPSYPSDGAEVSQRPRLEVANGNDPDGSTLVYTFEVFDASEQLVTRTTTVVEDRDGTTDWTLDLDLTIGLSYSWQARATDPSGLNSEWSERWSFTVSRTNTAPTDPTILSPEEGADVATLTPTLVVSNSSDPEGDVLVYEFQIDRVPTFNSSALIEVEDVPEGEVSTAWTVSMALEENGLYYWRARSDDGAATSNWVNSSFRINVQNEAPPVPTLQNPSDDSAVEEGPLTLSLVTAFSGARPWSYSM